MGEWLPVSTLAEIISIAERSIRFMGSLNGGQRRLEPLFLNAVRRGVNVTMLLPFEEGVNPTLAELFDIRVPTKGPHVPMGILVEHIHGVPLLGQLEIRFMEGDPPMSCALVDDEYLFVDIYRRVSGLERTSFTSNERSVLEAFLDHFEYVYRHPFSWNLLPYEDLYEAAIGSRQQERIVAVSDELWDDVIKTLARKPEELYLLSPRKFEELVAELLAREGFEARLTPVSRDGGRDILAFYPTPVGQLLYLVECKRYRRDRPVDVGVVRALYGIIQAERASAGLIVTTSHLSPEAGRLKMLLQYQIMTREYDDIVKWLRRFSRETR